MSRKPLFIAWASHSQRFETLAVELDGQLSLQYETQLKGPWLTLLRYLVQGWKTWRLLERERPEVVIVQVPPVFAPLIVAVWCELRGKTGAAGCVARYALDTHTGTYHDAKWRWALPIQRLLSRRAVVTLVTGEVALSMLRRWNARGLYLVDGLPTFSPASGMIGSQGDTRVAVISTFSGEPIAEIFAAARLLPHVTFYLTGDPEQAAARLLEQKPENVILTGFLRGGTYTALLENVHGLVILTERPYDLSGGAYDALAVAKPALVSDIPEMRRCYTRGFIHVINTPEAIAAGITKMLSQQAMLIPEVIAMRSELVAKRQSKFEEFVALLR